ncbi:hypothetical protein [Streptomyces sp. WL006]|uniref:hypothetical protein n=1 Tax=Streptomyces sp. WL006 TaxID=3423915 RepID=UPI003F6B23FC
MAASPAQRAWDDLNARQRTYLIAFYKADQSLEDEQRQRGAQGNWGRAPARVWRRIDLGSHYSPVTKSLRAEGIYDSGTGATLAALADRGLIESGYVNGALSAWMTRAGRAAARAGLGHGPRWTKPKWALSPSMWEAVVKVAATGTAGLPTSELWNSAQRYLIGGHLTPGNRGYLKVVKTYVAYTPAPSYYNPTPPPVAYREERRVHLTDAGRQHYVERLEEYREMYDEVEAPDLSAPAT